jgi:hypothetical protein
MAQPGFERASATERAGLGLEGTLQELARGGGGQGLWFEAWFG